MSLDYLLIIDPQYDFCDKAGSLYVKNAEVDMQKLAKFIDDYKTLSKIFISLDSHHYYQIFHTIFWRTADGKIPDPFTIITLEDLEESKYIPVKSEHIDWANKYLRELNEKGKILMIWPYHCIIGSKGASVNADILSSVKKFEERTLQAVEYIMKGSNILTEHYSILKSEVAVADDISTRLNRSLITKLLEADRLFIGGEALSHCVASSVMDILQDNRIDSKKLVILTDTSSSVTGAESMGIEFLKTANSLGVSLKTTEEILTEK